jgi:sulfite exporter TauE/SafE
MVHAVLPCPILYPVYLYALARGAPLEGAISLAVVGAGTIPLLLASGLTLDWAGNLSPAGRGRLHRVLGGVFVLLAAIPLTHGLSLLGVDFLPHLNIPVYQPLG